MLPVTALYAGLLAVAYAVISFTVGITRAKTGTMYGDGKDGHMQHLSRAQGNASEYIPIGLILLTLLELNSTLGPGLLHAFGLTYTVLRVMHVYQLSHPTKPLIMRQVGFLGTVAMIAFGGVLNLIAGFSKS